MRTDIPAGSEMQVQRAVDDAFEVVRVARSALGRIAVLIDHVRDKEQTGLDLIVALDQLRNFQHALNDLEAHIKPPRIHDESSAADVRYHEAKEDGRIP
jgi:hypothetical protein